MVNRTRVLFFHTASDSFGGGSQMLLRLLNSLNTKIFEPLLLSQYEDKLCEHASQNGITIKIVPFRGALDTYNRGLLSASPIEIAQIGLRIGQFNAEAWRPLRDADVVWCKNLRALLTLVPYTILKRTPIIWNIGLGLESDGKIQYLNTLALRLADEVFIESRSQARSIFTDDQYRQHEEKFTIFHKGIDVERFSPKRVENGHHSTYRVGTAASLTPRKGLEYFIDAAAKINAAVEADVEFLLAGKPSTAEDEKYAHSLRNQAERVGIEHSVQFLGWVDKMPQYLDSLDVFVLSSLNEGIPGAVREALAMEVPVVATDIGGTAEAVINGETGLLVPSRDSTAIADCVIQLLMDSNERERLGKNGRQHIINEFSVQDYIDQYEEFLLSLAGNR